MFTTLESVTDTMGHNDMLALVDLWAHDSYTQTEQGE